jgi:hypothetical protein
MAGESRLDAFRRNVSWNLACGALADVDLPVIGDDGGSPVVVALDEEPISLLLGRLRAVGGYANLFVLRADNSVSTVQVVDERCAIGVPDDDIVCPPSATSTVGMFLDYLEHHPNGVVLSVVSRDRERPALARDARVVELAGAGQ